MKPKKPMGPINVTAESLRSAYHVEDVNMFLREGSTEQKKVTTLLEVGEC